MIISKIILFTILFFFLFIGNSLAYMPKDRFTLLRERAMDKQTKQLIVKRDKIMLQALNKTSQKKRENSFFLPQT